jgi:hypothetical protein
MPLIGTGLGLRGAADPQGSDHRSARRALPGRSVFKA